MPPRDYECRCCPQPAAAPCNQCGDGAAQLVIEVSYPSGSGVMTKKAEEDSGYTYGDLSTECELTPESDCIRFFVVTNEGSGYTSCPTATLSCFDGSLYTAVQSPIVSVSVTDGGSGYSSAPAVALSGATSLSEVQPASLYCDLNASVNTVAVTAGGSGYTEPPTVHLHGGGGTGATAVAAVSNGQVQSISVTNGGSGYKYPPTVALTGGGGTGAAATATVLGKVGQVHVVSLGLYKIWTQPGWPTAFPTLAFSGGGGSGAAATIQWNGSLVTVNGPSPCVGAECDGAVVSISGGGGSGAAVEVQSSLAEAIVIDIDDGCGGSLQHEVAFANESSNGEYPLTVTTPAPGYLQERAQWIVEADVSLSSRTPAFGPVQQSSPASLGRWFSNEAYRVATKRYWIGAASSGGELDERYFVKRNATRQAPNVKFTTLGRVFGLGAAHPPQASLPELSATWQQETDIKGDPYWLLASLSVQKPGRNLRVMPVGSGPQLTTIVATDSNLFGGSSLPDPAVYVNYSWSTPVVSFTLVRGFATQPVFSVSFRQTSTGVYEIDQVAVSNGGVDGRFVPGVTTTTRPVVLSLDLGYQRTSPVITATVSGGVVTSVAVTNRGVFDGPASIASIDSVSGLPAGLVAGSSTQTLETAYGEPEVTARGPYSQRTAFPHPQGSGAVLTPTLQQQTDANGRDYWEVTAVSVQHGGGNYMQGEQIVFVTGFDSYEQSPALATINLPSRRQPTLSHYYFERGSRADLRVVFEVAGTGLWRISDIQIISGGEGHENGDWMRLVFDDDTVEQSVPDVYIATDADTGAITGFTFASRGLLYAQSRSIESITVVKGGRFYKKTTTTASVPVVYTACKGGPGDWEELTLEQPDPPPDYVTVGEGYSVQFIPDQSAPSVFLPFTRRCPLPNVSFEIQ